MLVHNEEFLGLYARAGVPVLDDEGLLSSALVPALFRLPDEMQTSVLRYLNAHWERLSQSLKLVTAVSDAKFVPTG